MSNFNQYWFRLCSKNHSLLKDDTKMTITVESFKKQMAKAYDAGTTDRAAVEEKLRPQQPQQPTNFEEFRRAMGL